MKKTVTFALGLALVTGAIMPFTNASRSAYHAYITSQQNRDDYRHFSEGRRTTNQYNSTTTKESSFSQSNPAYSARYQRNSRAALDSAVGASRASAINTTYVEATSRTQVDRDLRPFATRAGVAPWRTTLRNVGRTSRVIATPLESVTYNFETFENDAFSVQLPVGAQAKADDAHAFMVDNVDIRIKKFAAGTCDNAYGFKGCANNISKAENVALVGGKGRLIAIARTVRQTYKSDTVLGELNQPADVYTEEFTTKFTDGEQYTLYRYATQDVDGGVYFIEVKSPRQDASEYVGVVNKVFDSFRIYAAQS